MWNLEGHCPQNDVTKQSTLFTRFKTEKEKIRQGRNSHLLQISISGMPDLEASLTIYLSITTNSFSGHN